MEDQSTRDVIIGTAGHIDHGKTALVEALTGINTDRLPDEQRTGMTIDLGFAHLDLGEARVGIVDVPGHERFIKNMVAGATGVDLALLVIAADDSVMPQTLEHLETLELLGVTRGVIALTKVDLVSDEQRELATEDIREWLADTAFAETEIVPVSAVTGDGIDRLRATLATLVNGVQRAATGSVFRLPIDRAFTISGAGTVVTGSAMSGVVRVGDTVEVLPAGTRARVRGIHRHGEPQPEARAGQRAALNLAGIDYRDVQRCYELSTPGYLEAATTLDASVRCLPSAPLSFRVRSSAHLCIGTGDSVATIVPLETDELKPGQTGIAQIHTAEPVAAEHGQPFILRSAATGRVVGGGRVLRPVSRKRRRSDADANRSLHVLLEGGEAARLQEAVRLAGATPITALHLCRDAGLSPERLDDLLSALRAEGKVVPVASGGQEFLLHASVLERLETLCREIARDYHEAHPVEPGIPEAQLSSRLSGRLPDALWPGVRDRLLDAGVLERVGDRLALADFEVSLSPAQRDLKESCARQLREGWLSPPEVDDLRLPPGTGEGDLRAALELLQLEGAVVKVSPNLWMDSAALAQAKQKVADECGRTGALSVAQIRDLLQTSRRYAVPLCEYLDRIRFTRREGDLRVLAETRQTGS